jgi:hypothetical protein
LRRVSFLEVYISCQLGTPEPNSPSEPRYSSSVTSCRARSGHSSLLAVYAFTVEEVFLDGSGSSAAGKIMAANDFRIFIVDGAATIGTGVLALFLIPQSPRHTKGGLRFKGWLSEREADVLLARLDKDDPLKTQSGRLAIQWRDIFNVLTNWRLWPHLIMCLSGLQAGAGAGAWSGTILQTLGFSAISE